MGEGECGGPGFVLINRYRTSPAMFPMPSRDKMRIGHVKGAKVVFARTNIASVAEEEKILRLGYSDEIVVYLNRKLIFSEKNALSYRDDDALGTFGRNNVDSDSFTAGQKRTTRSCHGIQRRLGVRV